jgi:hypothetical protein
MRLRILIAESLHLLLSTAMLITHFEVEVELRMGRCLVSGLKAAQR